MIAMQAAGCGQVGLGRLEAADGALLARLFGRLSPETVYRRFFSPLARIEAPLRDRLLDLDHHDREAVAAVLDGEVVGVARYARGPEPDAAELAVVVADAWQRQGVGTRLLAALGERARGEGVRRFTVTVQADNRPAFALLARFAPMTGLHFEQGVCTAEVVIPDHGGAR